MKGGRLSSLSRSPSPEGNAAADAMPVAADERIEPAEVPITTEEEAQRSIHAMLVGMHACMHLHAHMHALDPCHAGGCLVLACS